MIRIGPLPLLALAACTAPADKRHGAIPAWPDLDLPGVDSVLLFEADTLRADRLPWYDGPNDTLPETGDRPWLVADPYIAASSWTVPTVSSVLTGLPPAEHGMVFSAESDHLRLPSPTLQEHLGELGVSTGFFTGNTLLDTIIDADRGWDQYELDETDPGNALALADLALDWLDRQDGPFFLMVQPMDAHHPWAPLPEFDGRFHDPADLPFAESDTSAEKIDAMEQMWERGDPNRERALAALLGLYDEEILGIDASLSRLLDGLEARGLSERTLVVFTADHGETMLDDDHELGHAGTLRPELVRVPFAMLHPALAGGRVDDCPISQVDLAATLLSILDLPAMDVPSRPFRCGDVVPSTLFYTRSPAQLLYNTVTRADTQVVIDCDPGVVRLYDLAADPDAQVPWHVGESPALDAWIPQAGSALAEVLDRWPSVSCPVDYAR